MYCKKCYTNLTTAGEFGQCPKCRRSFDPRDPTTYLSRPFPSAWKIARQIIFTTLIGLLVAFMVATFQTALFTPFPPSGH